MSKPSPNLSTPGGSPTIVLPDLGDETVFVVDDDPNVLNSAKSFLTRLGYNVRAFEDPKEAVAAIGREAPKVIVTDNEMPGMTGLELADGVQSLDPTIKIIMVTGVGDEAAAQAALRLGLSDYLTKPIDLSEMARAVQKAFMEYTLDEYEEEMDAWIRAEVVHQTEVIRDVTLSTLATLVNALEARSSHFKGHSENVAIAAAGIARALELSEVEVRSVRTAGLLHDVGMIAVPDSVVDKPGALDEAERRAVLAHCARGAEILEPMEHLGRAITYVLEHHERIDGSGYPDGKRGADISLGGQIVGLAEVWIALTEPRPYRAAMSKADAMGTLVGAAGSWFSAEILEALRVSES